MRIVVLLLGLLGSVTAGFLGFKWKSDAAKPEQTEKVELVRAIAALGQDPKVKEELDKYDRIIKAAYALLASFPLGIIGAIVAYTGRGIIGGVTMLPAPVVAAVLQTNTLVFSSPLVLAGLLAFTIRPRKPKAPAP
jgi:hypothetical protein